MALSEKKSFWQKLKAWIDGEEILINADKYISTREKPELPHFAKHFST